MRNIVFSALILVCLAVLALCALPAGAAALPAALVPAGADVGIAKSADPSPVDAGATLTYTLVYSNAGPSAADNVLITDTLPAGVTFVRVVSETPELPGPWQSGQLLSWSGGALNAGVQGRIVFTVKVDSTLTAASLVNGAAIGSGAADPNAANDTAHTSTPVQRRADIALLKTDSPDPVTAGSGINYTLWVDNNGPSSATGVRVTDTLPAGVWLRSATPGYSGTNPLVWNVGALAASARKTITLAVMVNDTTQGTIRNDASASAAETDPQPANNSDDSSSTVRGLADLAVYKADSPDPVIAGKTLTYTLTITNSGPAAATSLKVTDTLPSGVTLLSGSPGHTGSNPVVWTVSSLAAGASKILTATVRVEPATRGVLTNRVTVDSLEIDPSVANNSMQGSTTVDVVADLSVIKSDSLDPVPPLGRLTYTIQVNNAGPSAATGVRVTDTIPEGGNYVSGSPGKDGYNPIYWAIGNLAAGATKTLTFTMDLDSRAGDSLNNKVSAFGKETDPNTINNRYTEYTEVRAVVDLSVTTSESADPVAAGTVLTYTLLVRNAGPAVASGVKVSDTWPSAATFYAATPGSTGANPRLWSIGSLAVNATKVITVAVRVGPGQTGWIYNRSRVTCTEPDTVPANDAVEEGTEVRTVADIMLTKTDAPDPVSPGSKLSYTLVVKNQGPSIANSIKITDALPAGVTFLSATPGYNSSPLRWSISQLLPGTSKTYTATVTVGPTAAEPLVNQASATSAAFDPAAGNNTVSAPTDIQYRPAMTMTKSAPATAVVGQALAYTYTLSYDATTGDGSPISDLVVTDDVAGSVAYLSGDDADALLEPGETWTWAAQHTVQPDDADPLVNNATASGHDKDGDVITARASAQTNILFQPALSVNKAGPSTARLGETVAYSVTVQNDATHGDGSAISQLSVTDTIGVVGLPIKTGGDADALLEEGETWVYPVTYRPKMGDPNPLINLARAAARDRDGDALAAEDNHSLALHLAPAFLVSKTGPATATVGQRVVFTCTLAQDTIYGDSTPIDKVDVTDSVAGPMTLVQQSGGDDDDALEAGETWTYTAAYTIDADDPDPLVNVVTATGEDEHRDSVTGTAEHRLDIKFGAALTLDKTGPSGGQFGQAVVYTVTVSYDAAHSDGSAIGSLAITDTLTAPPTLARKLGGDSDALLEPGESWVYAVTRTIADADRDPLVNTARVAGRDRDGDLVAAQDSHTVRLPTLALGAVSEAEDPVCADSRAYYAATVANAGAFPLTNLVVTAHLPEHVTFIGTASTFGYVVDGARQVHWTLPGLGVGASQAFNVALGVQADAAGSTLELCIGAQAAEAPLATRCASTSIISCVTPLPDRGRKLYLPLLLR
jgi:uncharacterized repeat protein (TIGR01451 family)